MNVFAGTLAFTGRDKQVVVVCEILIGETDLAGLLLGGVGSLALGGVLILDRLRKKLYFNRKGRIWKSK